MQVAFFSFAVSIYILGRNTMRVVLQYRRITFVFVDLLPENLKKMFTNFYITKTCGTLVSSTTLETSH